MITKEIVIPQALLVDETIALDPSPKELLPSQETSSEQVRNEFEKLWNIYGDRRVSMAIDFSNRKIVDRVIATRYYDGSGVEEVYWCTDIYSRNYKRDKRSFVTVRVLEGDYEVEIFADDDQPDAQVRKRDTKDRVWHGVSEEEAEGYIFEFFHRTSDAKAMNEARTPKERAAANAHARKLLGERFPMLIAQSSSEE